MFLKTKLGILLLSISVSGFCNIQKAEDIYRNSSNRNKAYIDVADELIKSGLYYASIPFVKEYLLSYNGKTANRKLDRIIDTISGQIGVKQFEVLSHSILKKSNAPTIRYVRAKKYFRKGNYQSAIKQLESSIERNHAIMPFSLLLLGTTYSIINQYTKALISFEKCVKASNSVMSSVSDGYIKKQLEINRDYCLIGISRTQFSAENFEKANLSYLDLDKSSYVWPEILYEEAWTSFYQENYNRTLGKLVSYKAPVLNYLFNPDVDVLRAFTYYKLCLNDDVKYEVSNFYRKYEKDIKKLKTFLRRHKKNYNFYFNLASSNIAGKSFENKILKNSLADTRKDMAYQEMRESFAFGVDELKLLQGKNSRFIRILKANINNTLGTQKNIIGSYVRKKLFLKYREVYESFEKMSYLKLSLISMRKKQIYDFKSSDNEERSRGDIKYLQRNEKQYFWSFNGEFWADELGDYVFALRSECR